MSHRGGRAAAYRSIKSQAYLIVSQSPVYITTGYNLQTNSNLSLTNLSLRSAWDSLAYLVPPAISQAHMTVRHTQR
jgi:hypothetical protein